MNRFRVLAACTIAAAGLGLAAGNRMPPRVKPRSSSSAPSATTPIPTRRKWVPGLKALFKKDKMANGKKPTEANVRTKIDEGGNGMPAYKDMLERAEKDDVWLT